MPRFAAFGDYDRLLPNDAEASHADPMLVRWFGPSWNAPVCEYATHVRTPQHAHCTRCGAAIALGDQGVIMEHLDGAADASGDVLIRGGSRRPVHLDCLLLHVTPRPGWAAQHP